MHTAELPLAAYASLGLARVAVNRRAPDQAREILEPLTSQMPRFGSAHRLLAENYHALGRSADAERAIRHANRLPAWAPYADPMVDALARESRNSTFLLRQASEADLATNAEWSEYLARRALEVDPDNPDVLSKLGRILRTLGRNEEALDFFSLYNKKVPGDFQGLAHIGSCLSDLGRFEEAERFLREALEGVDDALTHYNLGVVLAATNRAAEAALEYRRAFDRDPLDLGARNNLAAVLVKQGQVAAARRELSSVLQIDPEMRWRAPISTSSVAETVLDHPRITRSARMTRGFYADVRLVRKIGRLQRNHKGHKGKFSKEKKHAWLSIDFSQARVRTGSPSGAGPDQSAESADRSCRGLPTPAKISGIGET